VNKGRPHLDRSVFPVLGHARHTLRLVVASLLRRLFASILSMLELPLTCILHRVPVLSSSSRFNARSLLEPFRFTQEDLLVATRRRGTGHFAALGDQKPSSVIRWQAIQSLDFSKGHSKSTACNWGPAKDRHHPFCPSGILYAPRNVQVPAQHFKEALGIVQLPRLGDMVEKDNCTKHLRSKCISLYKFSLLEADISMKVLRRLESKVQ
jgi:hypothetical protein